jgi:hypothetical protein
MTDQTMRAAGAPQFSIGHVLGTSFSVLLRNLASFFVIAIIVSIPSILVARFYAIDPMVAQEYYRQGQLPPGFASSTLVSMAITILTSSLMSAALIFGTFQDLRGQRASIGDSISRGFSALVPVIIAAIAFSILLTIGIALLVIPGLILLTMLWVYVPAIVIEKTGVGGAFSRSRELTKGRRWTIFGLFIVVGIAFVVASWIVGAVFGLIFGVGGVFWLGQLVQLLAGMFSAVMAAVGYYYLRSDKEGVAIGDIAKVFD